jgi:hypothetical protein
LKNNHRHLKPNHRSLLKVSQDPLRDSLLRQHHFPLNLDLLNPGLLKLDLVKGQHRLHLARQRNHQRLKVNLQHNHLHQEFHKLLRHRPQVPSLVGFLQLLQLHQR